ncbi:membrane-bound lytic murein transglycosylase D [Methylophilus rhizosphaerae]|uniref:Membrane-bound lytic murein transglycosylase D n=1 Tax=Methylophilus rhizosphaerae TaxID=492660 RepID=A0A1G9AVY1_9PROT|nr:transglycosylase SLT domain-containing protein [Methylophilus rhizosphaerae]SDK30715.1 membrane-bound lytic murein transglycosylase D [Methylophilus rhizosphaerae]
MRFNKLLLWMTLSTFSLWVMAEEVEPTTLPDDSSSYDDSYGEPSTEGYSSSYQFEGSLTLQEDSLWDRVRDGFSMPDINSDYTNKHEQWYASRPDYVARMLERSKKYLYHIVVEVEKRGMPTEIALLPMIESGFNPKALSTSKASGIWQFVPSTGKDFGLKQNYWKDSRKDVTAATQAALNYLQKLYTMFGAWDLALAAYNAGEGTVARAIERNRQLGLPTDYQHLSLPDETRNYVPKLQAIKNIIFRPEEYGLTLNDIPNKPYFTTVEAPNKIDAKLAAELAGISMEEFTALNPSFTRPVLVTEKSYQKLLLPTWAASNFTNNLNGYTRPLSNWHSYQPKRGERLGNIANRFNISLYELSATNNLKPNKNLIVRRPLLVPAGAHPTLTKPIDAVAMAQLPIEPAIEKVASGKSTSISHKVKQGDTLSKLAKRYGVSSKQIMQQNHLKSQKLAVGQILQFEKEETITGTSGKKNSPKKSPSASKRHSNPSSSTKKSSSTSTKKTSHKR